MFLFIFAIAQWQMKNENLCICKNVFGLLVKYMNKYFGFPCFAKSFENNIVADISFPVEYTHALMGVCISTSQILVGIVGCT